MYVVLCVFVCMLCVLFVRRVLYLRKYKLPPLADGALPLVGHTFAALADLEALYRLMNLIGEGAHDKGQDVVRVTVGVWSGYVIFDIEDGLTISNSCLNKDKILKFFDPWFGNGLISADETIWKRHRRIIGPTFNQKYLDSFLVEMNKYSKQVVGDFAPHAGNGEFNHMEYMLNFSFQTICATAMGASVDETTKQNYLTSMRAFLFGMVERIRTFWYHSDFIFNMSRLYKTQARFATNMINLSTKIINERKSLINSESEPSRRKALLDLLLTVNKDGNLSDSELRQEVDTFIAAGADTTGTALTYILLAIGSYPQVQRRLYQELYEVFGDSERDVTKDDLVQLKYTEAVIKETLRLYPIVIATGRIVDRDVVLKNYVIPAGSRCFPAFFMYLRDPVWGADAAQFVPERWITPGRLPPNHNTCFAAFGMGKRICIGMNYSLMSMKTCVAHLLRHYRVTGDVTKLVCKLGIVITPSSGYHISIERRDLTDNYDMNHTAKPMPPF